MQKNIYNKYLEYFICQKYVAEECKMTTYCSFFAFLFIY